MSNELLIGLLGVLGAIVAAFISYHAGVRVEKMRQQHADGTRDSGNRRDADIKSFDRIREIASDDYLRSLESLEAYIGITEDTWRRTTQILSISTDVPFFIDENLNRQFQLVHQAASSFATQAAGATVPNGPVRRTLPRDFDPRDKQRFIAEAVPVDSAARTLHREAITFLDLARKTLAR